MRIVQPNEPAEPDDPHEPLKLKQKLRMDTAMDTLRDSRPDIVTVFHAEESKLLYFAHRYVRDRGIAEDLVQEGFMRLHDHWDSVIHPRAWLYRCIRNLALNYIRDHRREVAFPEQDLANPNQTGPDENLLRREALNRTSELVAGLGEDDRELLRLKYQEGNSYNQIADKIGIGVGNVGYRLHHLLKLLGDQLSQDLPVKATALRSTDPDTSHKGNDPS